MDPHATLLNFPHASTSNPSKSEKPRGNLGGGRGAGLGMAWRETGVVPVVIPPARRLTSLPGSTLPRDEDTLVLVPDPQ